MLKCPGTPTSPALDTLCTCWSTPITRNSFNNSSSKSDPSSSSILATCMVQNLANAGPCLVVVVCVFSFFPSDSLKVASTSSSSIPGEATYLNFRLVFFLIFLTTSFIRPICSSWKVNQNIPFSLLVSTLWKKGKYSNAFIKSSITSFLSYFFLRSLACTRMVRTVPGSVFICIFILFYFFHNFFYTLPANVNIHNGMQKVRLTYKVQRYNLIEIYSYNIYFRIYNT